MLEEQYAEKIGLLRRVETSLLGAKTFDLVEARVGKQVIQSAHAGTFSLSLTPKPGSDREMVATYAATTAF